jgi:hypothetical protein
MAPKAANLFVWLASLVVEIVGVGVVIGAVELEAEPVLLLLPTAEAEAALGLAVAAELGVEAGVEAAEDAAEDAPALEDEDVDSEPLVAALKGPMTPPCA